jgi:hypothetical protein
VSPASSGPLALLPSSIPSFIETCGRLASEAFARGDHARAREILEKAIRAAAIGTEEVA